MRKLINNSSGQSLNACRILIWEKDKKCLSAFDIPMKHCVCLSDKNTPKNGFLVVRWKYVKSSCSLNTSVKCCSDLCMLRFPAARFDSPQRWSLQLLLAVVRISLKITSHREPRWPFPSMWLHRAPPSLLWHDVPFRDKMRSDTLGAGCGSQGDLAAVFSREEKCYDERPGGRFVFLWPDGTCQLERLHYIKTACLQLTQPAPTNAQSGLVNSDISL